MRSASEEVLEIEDDTQKGKFLTFMMGKEEYGIEIRYVTEIIGGIESITEVPEVPHYIKGIINLRGKIIPVMDINLRFNKDARQYDDRTCIIVVDINDLSVGLIVDNVTEVLNINDEEIVDPPDGRAGFRQKYIHKIGKVGSAVKLLLDCEKLLGSDDYTRLTEIA
ncbi:MAG: chemotaxis protein CheW [Deltaproteobacteria bacterium]